MKNFVKTNYLFIIIFVLFLVIRIINFSNWLWYESFSEVAWISELISIKDCLFANTFPHFPLSFILYKIWALFMWGTIIWVKTMHLILNILTFFLVYKTALLFYKDKKVANWSILLYTISFYAYAWNTMWIDQDLALNPLLFILSLYLYKKLDLTKFANIILLWLSCALLSSSRLILWVIVIWIIFIDIVINKIFILKDFKFKSILKATWYFFEIFISYLVITVWLIYLMYLIFPDSVLAELVTYKKLFTWNSWYEWVTLLTRMSFLWQVFLYVSPLILAIIFLFKNFRKHQILLISTIIMIFYMLMWTSWWDPARWMMPILPILVILWWCLCVEYVNKKNRYRIILPSILLIWLNYFLLDYSNLPLNVSDYLSDPLNKVFILTTSVFSPIYLNSKLVFLTVWLTVILFWFALISKKKIYKSIFIIFALWVNLFFVYTDIFQIKQPNISSISKEIRNFCLNNCSIDDKIYSDSITKHQPVFSLWDKYIWNYFSYKLDENVVEINYNLHKNPILLSWTNLFSQNYPALDYIDIINNNWSGFVFFTHYFGNNKEESVLSNNWCRTLKIFTWNVHEVYWIVYSCDFYIN